MVKNGKRIRTCRSGRPGRRSRTYESFFSYVQDCYFIKSMLRFRNLSSASPFSKPFCNKAKSMS